MSMLLGYLIFDFYDKKNLIRIRPVNPLLCDTLYNISCKALSLRSRFSGLILIILADKLNQFGQTILYLGSSFVRITLPTVFKLDYFSFLDLLFTYWSGDEHSTWISIFEYLRKKKCFGPHIVYSVPLLLNFVPVCLLI